MTPTIAINTTPTIAQILQNGHDFLANNGWTRNSYGRDAAGNSVGGDMKKAVCVCAVGAIAAGNGNSPFTQLVTNAERFLDQVVRDTPDEGHQPAEHGELQRPRGSRQA